MSVMNDMEEEAYQLRCVIEQLRAENEALRKDAERYRWIRKNAETSCRYRRVGTFIGENADYEVEHTWWVGPAAQYYDLWIDAAMKEGK